ncbi:MAG: hypothetical protein RL653_2289, partial [Pseudomonadota bacterium]
MHEWRWVGRAVAFGVAFVALCWALGEGFGAAPAPLKGAAIVVGLLGGGVLAVKWVGGTGMWAVAIGLLVLGGKGFQSEQARFVKSVSFVEAEETWPEGATGVHFAQPLLHRDEWDGLHRWSQTINNRTESRTFTAVPLVAKPGGPVVAFDCCERSRDESPDGRWAVQVPADCGEAIRRSKEKLAAAKQVLAPGAETRVVNVYTSRERFEASGDMDVIIRMTGVFL